MDRGRRTSRRRRLADRRRQAAGIYHAATFSRETDEEQSADANGLTIEILPQGGCHAAKMRNFSPAIIHARPQCKKEGAGSGAGESSLLVRTRRAASSQFSACLGFFLLSSSQFGLPSRLALPRQFFLRPSAIQRLFAGPALPHNAAS